ncbi:MAG: SsrA-binding protein SmpB, partial [Patescibacteria group bacterium]
MRQTSTKNLAENRRARFDYEILETYEAGLELSGPEVKSTKNGRLDLSGSYALIRNGQAWLINSKIPPYQPKNMPDDYAPDRQRRLLLHKTEIASLLGKTQKTSLTLLPLRAYLKRGFIKIELGLGKSRKKHDKREIIK